MIRRRPSRAPQERKNEMSYDPKCEELAEHFMPEGTSRHTIQCIAQRLQDFLEDELHDMITDIKVRPE
jgi:hypothetical protein